MEDVRWKLEAGFGMRLREASAERKTSRSNLYQVKDFFARISVSLSS
jgi:hypothetical protein